MPLPNFHSCRLRKPEDFQKKNWATEKRRHEGKEYLVIMGRLKGETPLTEQAYRYSKDIWTESDARAHCKSHEGILFEPASGENNENKALLSQLYGIPWAILPGRIRDIEANIQALSIMDAKISWAGDCEEYKVESGTVNLQVRGLLEPEKTLFGVIFGSTETRILSKVLKKIEVDKAVDRIIFHVDSPGGPVAGLQALAEQVFQLREKKEIIAYVNSMACSAAYWLASAAHRVYIASKTDTVGSIGVLAIHQDFSEAEKKAGIKTTEIKSGKYKGIFSPHRPITAEELQVSQERLDYICSLFVNDVARNRGVDTAQALQMADAKIFTGEQAVNAGLVDGIKSLEEVNSENIVIKEAKTVPNEDIKTVDLSYLQANCPDLLKSIKAESYKAGVDEERKRVSAILAVNMPGSEKLKAEAIAKGSTHEQFCVALVEKGAPKQETKTKTEKKPGDILLSALNGDATQSSNETADDGEKEQKEMEAAVAGIVEGANNIHC